MLLLSQGPGLCERENVQEVISSIVSCYCARVSRLDDASMGAQLAKDSIFDAMADALTGGTAVQVAELMMETGDQKGHDVRPTTLVLCLSTQGP